LSIPRRRLLFSTGVLAAAAVGGALLWPRPDRSLATIRANGAIRIGYAVEAPFAFIERGAVTGESPEVARRIVSALGIPRIEWVQSSFDALLSGLEENRFDVVAAGMFITRERAQRVAFSEPTFHVQEGLLVRKGNPRQLHSYESAAADTQARLVALSGSVEQSALRALGVAAARLMSVPDAATGLAAVESGAADALALSSLTIRWMAMHEPLQDSEPAQPFTQSLRARLTGFGGFAFRREDRELMQAWNAAQRQFVGSPEHVALIARFGFSVEELPGATSTVQIVSQ
jgi:polar amino acid transport system substrate-binding protein